MRLIDGNKIVMSLADWWYSSFGQEETDESKAIKKVMEQVEKMVMEMPEIVRCKDCKWYDPPHIKYNDGTREDYPKEPFVTADIGSTVGGKCIAKNKIYCTAHDRENPDDYEEIVMFRSPDDYCSYGEKQVTGKLKNPDDSLFTEDSEACKEQKSKLESDTISRQAVIDYLNKLLDGRFDAVKSAMIQGIRDNIRLLPQVEPPKKAEPKTDLVNRSDVLELAKSGVLIRNDNYKKVCEAINGLPSCHTCRECEPVEPKIYGNEHNCIMTMFGECSYSETGCGSCAVVQKVRNALKDECPQAEPERPKGEWIPCTKNGICLTELMRKEGQAWYGYKCSKCSHIHKGNALTECNFCPNCGADMRGDKECG